MPTAKKSRQAEQGEDPSPLLFSTEAASLLGLTADELEQRRRQRKLTGEPYRHRWWGPKQWRYRLADITNYFHRYTTEDNTAIGRVALALISQGISLGASDIHIEEDVRHIRVRLRIDGLLHETIAIPKHIGWPLVFRLLMLARVPSPRDWQQFHFGFFTADKGSDPGEGQSFIRLSYMPIRLHTRWGAKIVLHILPASPPASFTELGMADAHSRARAAELLNPRLPGLVLFAGPRGEGLTTTLRVALSRIEQAEQNIYYFNDTADFPPNGSTHIIYDRELGFTPTEAVKTSRRQGAHLLAFGDIHDRETALAAVEAAETGLPVWAVVPVPGFAMRATLKESAQILFTRFQGWGISPERLKAILRGSIQQRLLRTLCPDCRQEVALNEALPWYDLDRILPYIPDPLPKTVYRASHCGFCRDTGYRGRTGLFTVYKPDWPLYDAPESFADFAVRRFVSGEFDAAELRRSHFFR